MSDCGFQGSYVQEDFAREEDRSSYNLRIAATSRMAQLVGLTRGLRDDGCPMWSPDSKQIAFLSDRSEEIEMYQVKQTNVLKEKTTQPKSKIWILDLKGSDEVRQISYCPEGVQTKYREPLM